LTQQENDATNIRFLRDGRFDDSIIRDFDLILKVPIIAANENIACAFHISLRIQLSVINNIAFDEGNCRGRRSDECNSTSGLCI
jgi:hypothetical protein